MSGKCYICDAEIDETVSFDGRFNPIQLDPCHTCMNHILEAANLKSDDDEETVEVAFDEADDVYQVFKNLFGSRTTTD